MVGRKKGATAAAQLSSNDANLSSLDTHSLQKLLRASAVKKHMGRWDYTPGALKNFRPILLSNIILSACSFKMNTKLGPTCSHQNLFTPSEMF